VHVSAIVELQVEQPFVPWPQAVTLFGRQTPWSQQPFAHEVSVH
jgi:hypothetical protein